MTEEHSIYQGPVPDHIRNLMERAHREISEGGTVYYRFTCVYCSSRQTFDQPNVFFKTGKCEECKATTDLFDPKANAGFLLKRVLGELDPLEYFEGVLRRQLGP